MTRTSRRYLIHCLLILVGGQPKGSGHRVQVDELLIQMGLIRAGWVSFNSSIETEHDRSSMSA